MAGGADPLRQFLPLTDPSPLQRRYVNPASGRLRLYRQTLLVGTASFKPPSLETLFASSSIRPVPTNRGTVSAWVPFPMCFYCFISVFYLFQPGRPHTAAPLAPAPPVGSALVRRGYNIAQQPRPARTSSTGRERTHTGPPAPQPDADRTLMAPHPPAAIPGTELRVLPRARPLHAARKPFISHAAAPADPPPAKPWEGSALRRRPSSSGTAHPSPDAPPPPPGRKKSSPGFRPGSSFSTLRFDRKHSWIWLTQPRQPRSGRSRRRPE